MTSPAIYFQGHLCCKITIFSFGFRPLQLWQLMFSQMWTNISKRGFCLLMHLDDLNLYKYQQNIYNDIAYLLPERIDIYLCMNAKLVLMNLNGLDLWGKNSFVLSFFLISQHLILQRCFEFSNILFPMAMLSLSRIYFFWSNCIIHLL